MHNLSPSKPYAGLDRHGMKQVLLRWLKDHPMRRFPDFWLVLLTSVTFTTLAAGAEAAPREPDAGSARAELKMSIRAIGTQSILKTAYLNFVSTRTRC